MHQEQGTRGFSFEIEDAPPEAPNLGRLDLDFSELGAADQGQSADPIDWAPEAPARAAPPSAAGTPLMPHAAAAGRSPAPARPLLAAFADRPADPAQSGSVSPTSREPAELASSAPAASAGSPAVRRLSFPAAGTTQKPSPRPSTRFADSVGRSRPVADSVGELALEGAPPPEDLPGPEQQNYDADERSELSSGGAAPLLRKAGSLWRAARGTATELGGRGLDSGRLLAGQMSDALRERIERPRGAQQSEHPAGAQRTEAPRRKAEVDFENLGLPSVARRPSAAWIKKSAGPLLALTAALSMFIASRHLLGSGGIELSSTSPAVPDLGKLEQAGTRASAPAAPAAPAPGAPAGPPPPMVTEVVPLPPGMAWPGKGLLEVVTSEDELVYVDGVFTGRGPLRRIPVSPGAHEVSIRKEGSERQGTAEVQPGKTTRALFQRK